MFWHLKIKQRFEDFRTQPLNLKCTNLASAMSSRTCWPRHPHESTRSVVSMFHDPSHSSKFRVANEMESTGRLLDAATKRIKSWLEGRDSRQHTSLAPIFNACNARRDKPWEKSITVLQCWSCITCCIAVQYAALKSMSFSLSSSDLSSMKFILVGTVHE